MEDYKLDDIETLKTNQQKTELTDKQQQALRRDVKKIMKRREEQERARRRAEMEHLYELGLYA